MEGADPKQLTEAILACLADVKWGLSIARLTKALNERHGLRIHRLELTGFVSALKMFDVVDIIEMPPANIITLDGRPIEDARKQIEKTRLIQKQMRGERK